MPAPLPRIGQAIICNGNLLRGKVKHQRPLWLTLLALALHVLPFHFYFETECSVYNLNELQADIFKLLILF